MKPLILIACVALAGCGSYLADRDAKDACSYYIPGTTAYADCYADAYNSSRASRSAAAAAISGAILSRPVYSPTYVAPVYTPTYRPTVTCQTFGGAGTNYQRTTTCY